MVRSAGRLLRALLAIAVPAAAPAARAQDGSVEYGVKAAFLTKFGAFADWPAGAFADPFAPMVVCVVGRDPFGGALDRAAQSQTAGGRPLAVRRLDAIGRGSGCHVAYLGGSGAQSVAEAARALAGTPVLTVTDQARGAGRGHVHFVVSGNRVRFHIDQVAAERGGVRISSKLLNLALSVRR